MADPGSVDRLPDLGKVLTQLKAVAPISVLPFHVPTAAMYRAADRPVVRRWSSDLRQASFPHSRQSNDGAHGLLALA